MSDTPKHTYALLCPTGKFAEQVLTHCTTSASIAEIDEHGNIADQRLYDFPDMELYELNAEPVVYDNNANEFMHQHCRLVDLGEYGDPDDWSEEAPIQPWPEEIIRVCMRLLKLHDVVRSSDQLLTVSPHNWFDNIIAEAARKIIVRHAREEIEQLDQMIADFRRTDPPVVLPDLDQLQLERAEEKHNAQV